MSEEKLSPWEQYKKNLGATRPWDFVKPSTRYVATNVAQDRLAICQKCPEFIKLTTQCKKCGCIMKAKTNLELATCPIGKW